METINPGPSGSETSGSRDTESSKSSESSKDTKKLGRVPLGGIEKASSIPPETSSRSERRPLDMHNFFRPKEEAEKMRIINDESDDGTSTKKKRVLLPGEVTAPPAKQAGEQNPQPAAEVADKPENTVTLENTENTEKVAETERETRAVARSESTRADTEKPPVISSEQATEAAAPKNDPEVTPTADPKTSESAKTEGVIDGEGEILSRPRGGEASDSGRPEPPERPDPVSRAEAPETEVSTPPPEAPPLFLGAAGGGESGPPRPPRPPESVPSPEEGPEGPDGPESVPGSGAGAGSEAVPPGGMVPPEAFALPNPGDRGPMFDPNYNTYGRESGFAAPTYAEGISAEEHARAIDDAEYRGRKHGARRTLFTAAAFYALGRRGGRKRTEARLDKEIKARDKDIKKLAENGYAAEDRLRAVHRTQEQLRAQLEGAGRSNSTSAQERQAPLAAPIGARSPEAARTKLNAAEVPLLAAAAVIPIINRPGRGTVRLERQLPPSERRKAEAAVADLERKRSDELAAETAEADQAAIEAAVTAAGHRIERSTWHSVEVDKHGHAVENPVFAYGEAFRQESQQERQPTTAAQLAALDDKKRQLGRLAQVAGAGGAIVAGSAAATAATAKSDDSTKDGFKRKLKDKLSPAPTSQLAGAGKSPIVWFMAVVIVIFLIIVSTTR